jgi:hypothetical protein
VQKVPQKAVAKAKLLIESRQQKRVLNIGGAQTTRGERSAVAAFCNHLSDGSFTPFRLP